MANEEVRINLTSSADTSGVDKMGAAVGGIAGDSRKAADGLNASTKSSKELSAELGRSVEAGSQAVSLFQNISTASQGGAAGMMAAARAGLGFGQAMKAVLAGAGPVGIILAGLGVAAGAIVSALSKPKAEADLMARSFEASKKAADAMDKARFDGLKAALSELNTALADSLKSYDAIAEANERIAKSADDAARAEVEKRKSAGLISDAQADAATKGIDARASARGLKNTDARAQFEKEQIDKALAKAEQLANDPRGSADFFAKESDAIELRRREANRLNAARDEAFAAIDRNVDPGETPARQAARRYDAEIKYRELARAAKAAQAASDADAIKGGASDIGGNAEQTRAEYVAEQYKKNIDALVKAEEAADELRKSSKNLAEKMDLEAKTRAEIARINAERDKNLAGIRVPTQKEEEKERARLAGLTRDQLANMVARGDAFPNPKLAQERIDVINQAYPNLQKIGYAPAIAPQPAGALGAPGTITMADGTVVPVNRAQPGAGGGIITGPGGISRTFAPGAAQGPGRGAYREGDQAADAIKGATEAVKGSDTGDATAKAAAELKAAEEQRAAAVQASTEQTVAALQDMTGMSRDIVGVLTPIPGQISDIRSQIQQLWGAVRAANRKSNTTPA